MTKGGTRARSGSGAVARSGARSRSGAWLVVALVAFAGPAGVAAQGAAPACADVSSFSALDFWIGEWDVRVGGRMAGTNRIEKVLDGCAVMEHWTDRAGGRGMSLFYHDAASGAWKQVWVTDRATSAGGLKEKTLIDEGADGSLRFQGVVTLPDGRMLLDRTTLAPLEGGRVSQRIETSADDGATWQVRFDGVYIPRGAAR